MRIPHARLLCGSLLAISCALAASPARAASFGLVLSEPSAVTPAVGSGETLAGSLSIDVETIPVAAPTLFHLESAHVTASGGASFALDAAVPSPGLGVVQASGAFLIPTLFLRVTDGPSAADLAVPNVEGTLLFDGAGSVVGLTSTFQVESPSDGVLTVDLVAAAPEPGGAALAVAAVAALAALRAAKESAR